MCIAALGGLADNDSGYLLLLCVCCFCVYVCMSVCLPACLHVILCVHVVCLLCMSKCITKEVHIFKYV